MPQTAEAIIIGAGVMGASLAFHLTRAGMTNVLVVDKQGLCGGMTAKSETRLQVHPLSLSLWVPACRYGRAVRIPLDVAYPDWEPA